MSRPRFSTTFREQDLLQHAAAGFTDSEISESLGIATNTVSTHWKRLFAKMGVTSRAHAVAIFVHHRNSEEIDMLKTKVACLESTLSQHIVKGGRRSMDQLPASVCLEAQLV